MMEKKEKTEKCNILLGIKQSNKRFIELYENEFDLKNENENESILYYESSNQNSFEFPTKSKI